MQSGVVISSVVGDHVLLTVIVTVRLFARDTTLNGLQETVAVVGYMVGAGFRDLLAFSRTTEPSALEFAVF